MFLCCVGVKFLLGRAIFASRPRAFEIVRLWRSRIPSNDC